MGEDTAVYETAIEQAYSVECQAYKATACEACVYVRGVCVAAVNGPVECLQSASRSY